MDYLSPLRFMCSDCGHDTREMGERYMLDDLTWYHACIADRSVTVGMLCVGCVERRLGRQLNAGDFIDCPLNGDAADQSLRLRCRMRRHRWERRAQEVA